MSQSEGLDPKMLYQYSGEHLMYELHMFFVMAEKLEEKHESQYTFNAHLESFIIHASIIIDFFYKKQNKPMDAKATHFVKDRAKWKEEMLPFESFLQRFNTKRNKELAHLSYDRLNIKSKYKPWQCKNVADHLKKMYFLFMEHCDPELVHPHLFQFRDDLLKKG